MSEVSISRVSVAVNSELNIHGFELVSTPSPGSASPAAVGGNVLLLHGYGGCKEELLGLAVKTTEATLMNAYIFDLPGHGESDGMFSDQACTACLDALELAINPRVAVGHSIGARLALSMRLPELIFAISPPLRPELEGDRQKLLRTLRQRRVQEASPLIGLTSILSRLGEELPAGAVASGKVVVLLRASSDIATVNDALDRWKNQPGIIVEPAIKNSSHLDILTAATTAEAIIRNIKAWI